MDRCRIPLFVNGEQTPDGESAHMDEQTKRVAIIGAGPGGLAAAILLAGSGVRVDLYERLDRVGGRTATVAADGYRFDLGPTFFLYPRVLREIFRMVGRDLDEEVEMVRLDPQYRVQFEEGPAIEATSDPARMREQISKISPADAAGFDRFMAENRGKLAGFRPILERPFEGWMDLLKPDLLKLLPAMRPWNSLDSELKRYFKDARTRLAFSFQAKYLGMSPFRCPSIFSILSHLEYEHGVWHPLGGCGAVSTAMARVAQELGVAIHLDSPVDEVLFEGKRAVGLRTRGQTVRADAVVMNGDFAATVPQLVPQELRPTWSDKRVQGSKYSCSTYMLYLGIEGRYDDMPHHTIFVPKSYEQNLDEIENQHVLSQNPSVYVQNACVTDPGLAKDGHSTLYVLVPTTHLHGDAVDWETQRQAYREEVLDQVERMGFVGVRDRIRYERIVTPVDWSEQYAVHKGAVFNLTHNLGQMLHRRPHNRFDDTEGVYLVGGGTHPGSGLPVIFESARISSKLLCADLGVAPAWRSAEELPARAQVEVA